DVLLGQHRRCAAGQLPARDQRFHRTSLRARPRIGAPGATTPSAKGGVGMTRTGDRGAPPVPHVQQVIENTLDASELTYSRHPGAHGVLPGLIVELPGER